MDINDLLNYYDLSTYVDQQTGWLGAALAATTALIAGIINNRARRKQDARNNAANLATNKELAQFTFEKDTEAWNRQNLYNDPTSQMSRLQGAGLNPMLVYGSGAGGASGSAGSQPSYNTPRSEQSVSPVQIPEMLGQFQDFQMRQAQINNVKAQTQNTHQRTMTEAITREVQKFRGHNLLQDLSQKEILAPYQAAIIGNQARGSEAKLEQEWQRVRNLSQDEQLKLLVGQEKRLGMQRTDVEIESRQAQLIFQRYKNEWAKIGIMTSDDVKLRILIRMMNESGFNINDINPFGK